MREPAEVVLATPAENGTTAALAALLVGGVYADGWAHLNIAGLETFFTPWHGVLYSGFLLLASWSTWMVWRRRQPASGWALRVPLGYGWGLIGGLVFVGGGVLDMLWHVAFGVEVGLDALLSPTHLLLLTGGALLVSSPIRAATGQTRIEWPAVLALAAATALAGFFLSYLSVFADPGAREPLTSIPEGQPGHRTAELPAIAGLAGYLVSTVLLVAPILFLYRRRLLPWATTLLVGSVALPAAALTQGAFLSAALAAMAGASVVDLIAALRPPLSRMALAGLIPAVVWSSQLVGLAISHNLRWPPELGAGVVVLTTLLATSLAYLTRPAGPSLATTSRSLRLAQRS